MGLLRVLIDLFVMALRLASAVGTLGFSERHNWFSKDMPIDHGRNWRDLD